jgi:hypothetical protein
MTEERSSVESPVPGAEKKRLAAVIDMGATAIRMDIAEIESGGGVRRHE